MDDKLIYSFSTSEHNLKISSLAIDDHDNIYASIDKTKHIFQIKSDGSRKDIYKGNVLVEDDYARVIWNKKYGVISVEQHPRMIPHNYKNLESIYIDAYGEQYKIIEDSSLWQVDHAKYLCHYKYILHEYYRIPSLAFDENDTPHSVQENLIKISDLKFYDMNICVGITYGGFVFYHKSLIARLWNDIRKAELFILDNVTFVVNDQKSLRQYNLKLSMGQYPLPLKVLPIPQDCDTLIVSYKGDIIFSRGNNIYKIKSAFDL